MTKKNKDTENKSPKVDPKDETTEVTAEQTLTDIEKAQAQIAELTDSLARTQADFINYKRRTEADKISSVSYGIKQTILTLLPAIDNIERALEHSPEELQDNEYVKGVQGIAKQFDKALKDLNVEQIQTVGKPFNPETMEAVAIEGEGDTEEVAEELQAGYVLNGVVIRHAMVKIKKK